MEYNRYVEVLYKEPYKNPKRIKIINTLEEMQRVVGGCIDVIRYDDAFIICNKFGKKENLEPNVLLKNNTIYGSFFIIGDDYKRADFISLTEEQISRYINELEYESQIEYEMEEFT